MLSRELAAKAENAGRVMTHRQLLTAVWGPAYVDDVAYLRVLVGQLRQKLRTDHGAPELLETESGIGDRLFAEDA